ncbi:MAG TPA: adenylate/guanylate cyclase domain-containing protein [Acetobacteraceae bacterium]|nr:adenylate/guanylate cyclase domain-containing protein [Acetobacteraceae bacterium]
MPTQRRLAAVLIADVAGYSRLIGSEEETTLSRLAAIRSSIVDPTVAAHHGRLVRVTGDGLLLEFASVIDAVRCAIELQRLVALHNDEIPLFKPIEYRIGINFGEIAISDDGDIAGDGVNIAARLEALADPGGICVSARVQEEVAARLALGFDDMGEQNLKNIARPVRAYRLPQASAGPIAQMTPSAPALALPDRPSIAVLAFTNMSSDAEQEFFADGIAEDIITELSRSRALFVIARNSSFTYKGRPAPIRDVGRELGVRYVLEGSVRNVRNRVRVTAQLIEATTGGHVWAERYDRELADIFAVQDEITASVSAAIQPALERSERERVVRKPADSLDAWESYHRGMWHFSRVDAAENERARRFFQRAVELDPQFARAVAGVALTYLHEITLFRPQQRSVNLPLALEHASRAVAIDETDATGHAALARALWFSGRHREALLNAQRAVSLEPNSATAHGALGGARLWGGLPQQAIEPLETAMRLSPFDPLMPLWLHFKSRALYWSGDYDAAIDAASHSRQSFPNFRQPYNTLIAALGQVGRTDDAHAVLADGLARFGEAFRRLMSLPLSDLRELRPEDREHLIEGFRKAGVA